MARNTRWIKPGGVAVAAGVFLIASSTALAARNIGVDVSHFQGSTGIAQSSWNQMATEGITFAYIKSTEGLTGPDDTTEATNVARANTAGILNGVYHFAHPENRPLPSGAVQEADHFVGFAGSAIGPGHLRPVLDLESGSTLTTTALTDWVFAFVNEVMLLKGSAAEPIIYCNGSYATSELDSRVSSLDLWMANPSAANPQTGAPATTGQFGNWLMWQNSWTGTAGGINPIDMDVLHSEQTPLSALVIPEPASLAMLALSGAMVSARRRRRS